MIFKHILKMIASWSVFLLCPDLVFASDTVAVVHSYHREFRWVQEVNNGIADYWQGKKLSKTQPNVIVKKYGLKHFYMDAKSHQDNLAYLERVGKKIISDLNKIKPAVTIIADDEALKYVAVPLKNSPLHKFVFLGVNNDPRNYGAAKDYSAPEYNITGLISEHPFVNSLRLIEELFPERKNIYVFFDDSMTGQGIHKNLQNHLQKMEKGVQNRIRKTIVSNDWNRWQQEILRHQHPKSVFLFGSFYTLKERGQLVSEDKAIDWITTHSKVPELTVVSSHIADGMLLSISNPGYVHGYEACHLAGRLLSGDPVALVPIQVPAHKALHVNMKRAKQIGVDIPVDIIAVSDYFNSLGY